MANHASALKRLRQNVKRRARNRYWKSSMRTAIKAVRSAVEENDNPTAQTQLKEAISLIAHVAGKGVIHKKTASRKISRLTKLVNTLSAEA